MSSPSESVQTLCTRTCQISEATLQRIASAVMERLGSVQTQQEEALDTIDATILSALESRLAPIESRLNQIDEEIQNQLIERYGPIAGQLESIESRIPQATPTPEESDSEQPISPGSTLPSDSPIPQIDTDRPRIPPTTTPTPLRPDSYRPSPDCPQYDWCEPLRQWFTQLVSQFQQANLSATSNPQIRYYERQNSREQEGEQSEEESQPRQYTVSSAEPTAGFDLTPEPQTESTES